jgi:hypothetical protein
MPAIFFPSFDFIGRCNTCGFVAKHSEGFGQKLPPPRFYEIERDEREQGHVFHHFHGMGRQDWLRTVMVCLVGAAPYRVRMSGPSEQVEKFAEARNVLAENRQCRAWFPYRPGRTPSEHLEEFRMLQLENRRAELERQIHRESNRTQRNIMLVAAGQAIVSIVAIGAVILFTKGDTNEFSPINNNPIFLPTPAPLVTPSVTPTPTPQLTPDTASPTLRPMP